MSTMSFPPQLSQQVSQPDAPAESISKNPGLFEELHRKVKEVFPVNIEGAKLVINKGLSNHFQINHSVALGQATPSTYNFGATYVGTTQYGPGEAYPVILGDMDHSGSLSAQIIHQFSKRLRSKLVVQTQQSKWAVMQCDLDYKGDNFTASVTTANPDLLAGTGILVFHYLHALTSSLTLGAELLCHRGGMQNTQAAVMVGRYTGPDFEATANVGLTSLHLSYFHRTNERVAVGVELDSALAAKDSVVSLGYMIEVPKTNATFKATLDSSGTVAATLEKKLPPMPFSFTLSAFVNHFKAANRFGFGMTIG